METDRATERIQQNEEGTFDAVTRRAVLLGGVGAVGAASLGVTALAGAAQAAPAAPAINAAAVCTLTKELTQGPYWLSGALIRANVTEGKPGIALALNVTVVNSACTPLSGVLVEIWHADALGEYSGFVGGNGHSEADDRTFLRGGILTDSTGKAAFTTIYPGWYRGRCIHIHVKVHTGVTLVNGSYTGGSTVHTGQFFFDESVTTAVAAVSPYSTNTVPRTTLSQDGIYANGGVTAGLLTLTGSTTAGYTGTITVGVTA
jgi:protocatechuate 3,4-dioxygenase beta subunit